MIKIASINEIKSGKVSDIYFIRTEKILRSKGIDKNVVAEFSAKSLPGGIPWAVFSGLSDVLDLLKDIPVDVEAIPEGSIFTSDVPVMTISGKYLDFGKFETTILGLICQASGIATQAARFSVAAKGRPILSFGTRRMHPSICAVIDRNAYIGGCSGISTIFSGEVLGLEPSGTVPHSLILLFGDTVEAIKAFDDVIPGNVPRIALIDTFNDEKFEAVRVAEAMGESLYGVRLDTPASRRGNFKKILREVRWELDVRGYKNVKIIVSGGLDIEDVKELNDYVDSYGVGTSISNARVVDFSMDIVEIEGKKIAKRGKMSGKKDVYVGNSPLDIEVVYKGMLPTAEDYRKLTRKYMEKGKIVTDIPDDFEIRRYVLSQLRELEV